MNNLLDENEKNNFRFLASVLAVLCESSPITIQLEDIHKFWDGDIGRLQYDMAIESKNSCISGAITFSLKASKDG